MKRSLYSQQSYEESYILLVRYPFTLGDTQLLVVPTPPARKVSDLIDLIFWELAPTLVRRLLA